MRNFKSFGTYISYILIEKFRVSMLQLLDGKNNNLISVGNRAGWGVGENGNVRRAIIYGCVFQFWWQFVSAIIDNWRACPRHSYRFVWKTDKIGNASNFCATNRLASLINHTEWVLSTFRYICIIILCAYHIYEARKPTR